MICQWCNLLLILGSILVNCSINETNLCSIDANIIGSDTITDDGFGIRVSISNNYAVVGAWRDGSSDKGSAYIFEYNINNNSWYQTSLLTANDGESGDYFGYYVSISNNYVLIGAPWDDDYGSYSGSSYIFKRNNTNGLWYFTQKLYASDAETHEWYGYRVSLSNYYALIGAYASDDNGESDSGSAYIYEKSIYNETWHEVIKLVDPYAEDSGLFGRGVAIYNDYAIVG